MLDFNAFRKEGIHMSYQTMVQIFGAMMEDRETMKVEDWMARYSGYMLDTAKVIFSMRGEDFSEDDLYSFASHIAKSVYTKEYDEQLEDLDMSGFNEFIKASEGKDVAKS